MTATAATIGPVGFWYLALFGGLIPVAAIRSKRLLDARPLPPRKRYFASVILQQLVFLAITLATAWYLGLDLPGIYRPTPGNLATAALMLALAVGLLRPRWRSQVERRVRRVQLITPVDAADHGLWALISLLAGIGEELCYRGVMFELLGRLTGSVPAAVGLASLAFAGGHALQGWRSAAVTGIFALGFHGLVLQSGSLIPAMVVHAGYDLIAGFSYGRLARDAARARAA